MSAEYMANHESEDKPREECGVFAVAYTGPIEDHTSVSLGPIAYQALLGLLKLRNGSSGSSG